HAEVVGELQARRVTVARLIHEHVDRLVADWDAARLLEAQGLVEGDRAVDVGDSIAGMDQRHRAGVYSRRPVAPAAVGAHTRALIRPSPGHPPVGSDAT